MREQVGLFASMTEVAQPPTCEGLPAPPCLPDEPLIRVRPSGSAGPLNVGELIEHRELFYFLIWRDLKVRYKQTLLGSAWAVLQPFLMTLVFAVFLGKLVHVPSDGVPYAVFAYAGLLVWTFLSNAALSSSHSLVASAPLITKIYFPRVLIPAAAIAVRAADFAIASVIMFALLLFYGITPTPAMLVFPALVLLLMLLALGVGLWASSLNTRYRDVGTLMPVALQLWMFASPVVYPASLVPEKWRWLYALNPLAGIIEGLRASLFGTGFDWRAVALSAVITTLILACAVYSFRRAEESLADIV